MLIFYFCKIFVNFYSDFLKNHTWQLLLTSFVIADIGIQLNDLVEEGNSV